MDKLIDCFVSTMGIPREDVVPSLAYQGISQWDSVAHMALVAEIEDAFDVMLDTDEIIAMSNVAKIVEILASHGVDLDAAC